MGWTRRAHPDITWIPKDSKPGWAQTIYTEVECLRNVDEYNFITRNVGRKGHNFHQNLCDEINLSISQKLKDYESLCSISSGDKCEAQFSNNFYWIDEKAKKKTNNKTDVLTINQFMKKMENILVKKNLLR